MTREFLGMELETKLYLVRRKLNKYKLSQLYAVLKGCVTIEDFEAVREEFRREIWTREQVDKM